MSTATTHQNITTVIRSSVTPKEFLLSFPSCSQRLGFIPFSLPEEIWRKKGGLHPKIYRGLEFFGRNELVLKDPYCHEIHMLRKVGLPCLIGSYRCPLQPLLR